MTYQKKAPPNGDQIKSIVGSKVYRDPALSHEHRLTAMAICCASYRDYCKIDDEEMTLATGLCAERIDDILDDLQALGYLTREGYATRGGNPIVKLTVPWRSPAMVAAGEKMAAIYGPPAVNGEEATGGEE